MNQDRLRDKHLAVKSAESAGEIADSMEVRKALLSRVKAGEITLTDAQAELLRIKRKAKSQGLSTRAQVFKHG